MVMIQDNDPQHASVLLNEAVQALDISASGFYIDGTFGRGGHSLRILEKLGSQGRLLAIDKDPAAVSHGQSMFKADSRFQIKHASFNEVIDIVNGDQGFGKVNGVLLDLGVSSPQLDTASRGFSFQKDGDLDMRMNTESGITAAQWIASTTEQNMLQVFREYGEERFAKRIAKAIVFARSTTPITRTGQLASIIAKAHPAWEKGKNPATRCFQAIRIDLNNELKELQLFLDDILTVLADHGRLVVISFHSLEDRIVKRFINKQCRGDEYPPDLPVTQDMLNPTLRKVGKPIRASETELSRNPRSRSAVMRVAEKLPVAKVKGKR